MEPRPKTHPISHTRGRFGEVLSGFGGWRSGNRTLAWKRPQRANMVTGWGNDCLREVGHGRRSVKLAERNLSPRSQNQPDRQGSGFRRSDSSKLLSGSPLPGGNYKLRPEPQSAHSREALRYPETNLDRDRPRNPRQSRAMVQRFEVLLLSGHSRRRPALIPVFA